jgi:hypothetical protein
MRLLIRASNFRAPIIPGGGSAFAYGLQETSGFARPSAAEGSEARGSQGTTGRAQFLLAARAGQGTTGRASPRFRANGRQDTGGFAQATAGSTFYAFDRHMVLAAHPDLTASTLTNYVAQLRLEGTWLKQVANGGRIRNVDAFDLIFEDMTVPTAPARLDHENEEYDGVNGILFANIRIPSWVTSQRFIFRARYSADI